MDHEEYFAVLQALNLPARGSQTVEGAARLAGVPLGVARAAIDEGLRQGHVRLERQMLQHAEMFGLTGVGAHFVRDA